MKGKKTKPTKKKKTAQFSKTAEEIVHQMYKDMEWVNEHEQELENQYGSSVIAVHCEQVVASGADDRDVRQQAVDKGCPSDEILLIDILPRREDFSPDFV